MQSFAGRSLLRPRRVDPAATLLAMRPWLEQLVGRQARLEIKACPDQCAVRCDPAALALLRPVEGARLVPATEQDWFEEYLAPVIAVKVVGSLDEAIAHINTYGSHHTDAILTDLHANAMRFIREVDSSSVMINASTRFADGFEYGLGAEIGISTDKFHARGPVGLEGLTSLKWVVLGQGEVRGG